MPETSNTPVVHDIAQTLGLSWAASDWHYQLVAAASALFLAWLALIIGRFVLRSTISKLIQKSKTQWDDILLEHGFFDRCAHLPPALLMFVFAEAAFVRESSVLIGAQKAAVIYLLVAIAGMGMALLNSLQDAYNGSTYSQKAPITGLIQVAKLVLVAVVILLSIANLLDKSPLLLLSGLGALTAVLLLVFRDTILGFVAGIQIAANRMVNTGDWIEMPQYGADGTVLEVGLTTVKIQNWDKTISTIPTYNLISESVKNWQGMEKSAGRRIKRAIQLDINSVRFCDTSMLERLSELTLLTPYLTQKQQELARFNQQLDEAQSSQVNQRQLTNVGTLRAYLEAYLKAHKQINSNMTLMVRQLPPRETGLRLEIYCFSKEKAWVKYEAIQADIFDHIFAILPLFELRPYQRISDNR